MRLSWLIRCFLLLLLALVVWLLSTREFSRNMEAMSYDLRAKLLSKRTPVHPDLCLVGVDDEDLEKMQQHRGASWPWSDKLWVELHNFCESASVQAYDILFSEPRKPHVCEDCEKKISKPEHEISFSEIGDPSRPVLSVAVPNNKDGPHVDISLRHLLPATQIESTGGTAQQKFVVPHEALLKTKAVLGHVASTRDELGVMRSYQVLLPTADADGNLRGYLPSLALRAVMRHRGLSMRDVSLDQKGLHLGDQLIPCNPDGSFLFPESDTAKWNIFSASKIIGAAQNPALYHPELDAAFFDHKIVLIGAMAEGLGDRLVTPAAQSERQRFGVEVHFEAINTLLNANPIRRTPVWVGWAICLLLLLLSALPFWERPARMVLFYLVALVALSAAAIVLVLSSSWMIPVVLPFFGLTLGSTLFGTNYWQRERKARHDQELLEQSKQTFTDMLVHDLKNAMTPVVMFVDFMRMHDHKVDPKVTGRLVEDVETASKNTLRLVENLLDIRRIQEGRLPLHQQKLSVHEFVEAKTDTFHRAAARTQKTLLVKNDIDPTILTSFDAGIIQRVLENLVWNAVKYGRLDSTIEIETSATAGDIMIKVSNRCDTLTEAFTSTMFDAFISGVANNDLIRSTGLGLAFCKLSIEAHEGGISAHSPWPGNEDGLQITVKLPRNVQSA